MDATSLRILLFLICFLGKYKKIRLPLNNLENKEYKKNLTILCHYMVWKKAP